MFIKIYRLRLNRGFMTSYVTFLGLTPYLLWPYPLPLLIMYMPRAASMPAKAYFA